MQVTESSEQNKITENRFPLFAEIGFSECVGMKKKIISVILSILLLVSFASCNKEENNGIFKNSVVASSQKADAVAAAKDYADSKGMEHNQFASSYDAALSVVNGKSDFVVLDEYEGRSIEEENNLVFVEKCEYEVQYRAVFSKENTELCDSFNKIFEKMKSDGTIEKIKKAQIEGDSLGFDVTEGENGTLIMACDAVFENRAYYDENGELKGVDIEIAKAVCEYLGYGLEIKVLDFDEMFESLDEGNVDFILSSVEITEEREEFFTFSDVYTTLEYYVYKVN